MRWTEMMLYSNIWWLPRSIRSELNCNSK
jgi:hypothetical protein